MSGSGQCDKPEEPELLAATPTRAGVATPTAAPPALPPHGTSADEARAADATLDMVVGALEAASIAAAR